MNITLDLDALQPKHRTFIKEYLLDWNATAAYKRAGYRATGHSAEANASRLLKRPEIAAVRDYVLKVLDAEERRSANTHPQQSASNPQHATSHTV